MASETYKGIACITAKDSGEWRQWLSENHNTRDSVWLIIYKKNTAFPSIYYPEAVEEALCFGWIDSKPNKRDAESYYQYFSKRNPKSNWSKVNKAKVNYLIEHNMMAEAGYEMIALAKKTGTWDALNDVENLILPEDLKASFALNKTAFKHWESFPDSVKRGILEWIFNAKREATRRKRIDEVVALAAVNKRANQYSGNSKK